MRVEFLLWSEQTVVLYLRSITRKWHENRQIAVVYLRHSTHASDTSAKLINIIIQLKLSA
jgi:hypothetical protein